MGKNSLLRGPIFVAIAEIELKKGRELEFREWFAQSNLILEMQSGFIARKLLRSALGENYRIIVIMESKEAFANMHMTQEHAKLHEEALTFMTRPPKISVYHSFVD